MNPNSQDFPQLEERIKIFVKFRNCQQDLVFVRTFWYPKVAVRDNLDIMMDQHGYCVCENQNSEHPTHQAQNILIAYDNGSKIDNPEIVDENDNLIIFNQEEYKDTFFSGAQVENDRQEQQFESAEENTHQQQQREVQYQNQPSYFSIPQVPQQNPSIYFWNDPLRQQTQILPQNQVQYIVHNPYQQFQLPQQRFIQTQNQSETPFVDQIISQQLQNQTFTQPPNQQLEQNRINEECSRNFVDLDRSQSVVEIFNRSKPQKVQQQSFQQNQTQQSQITPQNNLSKQGEAHHISEDSEESLRSKIENKLFPDQIKQFLKDSDCVLQNESSIKELKNKSTIGKKEEVKKFVDAWKAKYNQKLRLRELDCEGEQRLLYECIEHERCLFSFTYVAMGNSCFKLRVNRQYHQKSKGNLNYQRDYQENKKKQLFSTLKDEKTPSFITSHQNPALKSQTTNGGVVGSGYGPLLYDQSIDYGQYLCNENKSTGIYEN